MGFYNIPLALDIKATVIVSQ